MVRRSNKSLSKTHGKNKTVRKSKSRKEKTRLVDSRHVKGTRSFLSDGIRINNVSKSNDGESGNREDGVKKNGSNFRPEDILGEASNIISENISAPVSNVVSSYVSEESNNVGSAYQTIIGNRTYLETLEQDRRRIYGDPFLSHQAIGLTWEGIFRNRYHGISEVLDKCAYDHLLHGHIPQVGTMFPADLVAEMLAGFKITRLARPAFHQDSADDAKVYISFSERFRK